jgi:hypothetical protein
MIKKYCLQVRHYRTFRRAEVLWLCMTDKFNTNKLGVYTSFSNISNIVLLAQTVNKCDYSSFGGMACKEEFILRSERAALLRCAYMSSIFCIK